MSTSLLVVDRSTARIERLRETLPQELGPLLTTPSLPRSFADKEHTVLTMVVSLDAIETYPTSVVRLVRRRWPWVSLILIDAPPTAQMAIATMKAGAVDYLLEGESEAEAVAEAVTEAYRQNPLVRPGNPIVRPVGEGKLIGTSDSMQPVFKRIGVAHEHRLNVLLHGESGTGKTLAARAIHAQSSRSGAPFVSIDCRCLTSEQARGLFFGREHAASSDAADEDRRPSVTVQEMKGGTVVLDHVDEMDGDAQDTLVHVLETRNLLQNTTNEPSSAHVRFIGVMGGSSPPDSFRTDLYYHLAELPIGLPALRERPEDILPLARHFLQQTNGVKEASRWSFSDEAQTALRGYAWPGNVRQLKNVVERAIHISTSPTVDEADLILPEHNPSAFVPQSPSSREERVAHANGHREPAKRQMNGAAASDVATTSLSFGDDSLPSMDELKKQAVKHAYEMYDGDVDRAAVELDIGRSTMYRMLDRYDLKDE